MYMLHLWDPWCFMVSVPCLSAFRRFQPVAFRYRAASVMSDLCSFFFRRPHTVSLKQIFFFKWLSPLCIGWIDKKERKRKRKKSGGPFYSIHEKKERVMSSAMVNNLWMKRGHCETPHPPSPSPHLPKLLPAPTQCYWSNRYCYH